MRKKKIVIDTSCLIALESIRIIEILCKLYKDVFIPRGVIKEFGEVKLKCIKVVKIKEPLLNLFEQTLNLGEGESEVITYAFRNKYSALIDDKKARNVAKQIGVKITGTLGFLVKAEKAGLIKSAYNKALELRKSGFYVQDKLLRQIKNFNT
jgi:predicted nucleic acid-binding protein